MADFQGKYNGDQIEQLLDKANDLNINWKDGVGEVTDQPLTVSPGSGAGSAPRFLWLGDEQRS